MFFTRKADAHYAITPGWPGKQLVLRNVEVPKTAQGTMLGVPGVLRHRTDGNTLTLELPALGPDEAPCRYAYTFKITGAQVIAADTK